MTLQPPVETRVDEDLAAYRRGPATLEQRLSTLPAREVAARYQALLARVELKAAIRRRDAHTSVIRAELAQERRDLIRGGNR
ncbi:MAG: hypothetical protein HIU88_10090 [Acidobacteria bacterium]|nr:hypothetical protein [Acidobacteriota bacterium]